MSLPLHRRPERSSLDLNNLPEEYGKQAAEESSTTTAASAETARFKKKKIGGMDEIGKVYECRFCSLKFCKSQALGGHMNRHRQERETETLNRARQLVYSNECLPATGVHLGFRNQNAVGGPPPVHLAGYSTTSGFGVSDQSLQFQPLYPRLPVQSTATNSLHPYIYSSSNPPHAIPFPSSYSPHHHSVRGDYYIGHVLPNISPRPLHDVETSYTCFGGPLSYNFPVDRDRPQTMSPDGDAPQNQIEGLHWNCNYGSGHHTGGNPAPDIDPSFP